MVWLTFITTTLWIGLCITSSFNVFLCLNFLTSVTTVTPVSGLGLPSKARIYDDWFPPSRNSKHSKLNCPL